MDAEKSLVPVRDGLPWALVTPDGKSIEGCGADGREPRRFASAGAALAFSAAQGEPWKSSCTAKNVETGEEVGPARVAAGAWTVTGGGA